MKKETIINLIRNKKYTEISLFLKNYSKEELNELSNDGETFPLLFAIQNNEARHFIFTPEVLEKLDLNMANKHGTTALMELAKRGRDEELKTLLKTEVDGYIQDNEGKTALDYAKELSANLNYDIGENSFVELYLEWWERDNPQV